MRHQFTRRRGVLLSEPARLYFRHGMDRRWILFGLTATLLAACAGGCVERTMEIQTNPSGAIVELNDQEVGRTPLQHDFLWYGTYSVTIRKEGYQTLKTKASVIAPIYQWIPLDLVAELLPFDIKDHHTLQYQLLPQPAEAEQSQALLDRAIQMRGDLESSQRPATQPSK